MHIHEYASGPERVPGWFSMQKHYSIGLLLSALGGLLGALLIALAASNTYAEWQNFRATQEAAEVTPPPTRSWWRSNG
jgi:hypothetical protein